MLQTDMRVMFVYPEDKPLKEEDRKNAGALNLILYYAPEFGNFYSSDLLQSLLPIMQKDCLIILVSKKGQV